MPAKELTPEQKEDAERLREAFDRFKARKAANGEPMNQDLAADRLGFNQSSVSQYLRGKIPLNAEALWKFCRLMDEKPEEISPSIYANELERSKALAMAEAAKEVDVSTNFGADAPMADDVMSALSKAPEDTRRQVEATVRMMLGLPLNGKQKAA